MNKIYPSASGFVSGLGVLSEYSSSCPRYMVISHNAPRTPILEIYGRLGAFHESRVALLFGDQVEAVERPVKAQIDLDTEYSGRVDFILKDQTVIEAKASMSKTFRREVIRKGHVKLSHLAQIVSYMIQLKADKGQIITGYYEETPEGPDPFIQKESRIFHISIRSDGGILIDGEWSGHNAQDQYKHTLLAAEVLRTREIKDRPINTEDFFKSPCFFCPLKDVCTQYDKKYIDSEELKKKGFQILKNSADSSDKTSS